MIINFILKLLALVGLAILLPLILLSILAVVLEDGFPVFFVQQRLGKNKKIFNLLKIRTMYVATPNLGTHEIDKDNYLKTGVLLRKLKIDELPQVLNFIKGDINLIGPRPGLPNQTELRDFRSQENIFDIKPGITGLGQVLGYDMSNPSLLSKIDSLYVKNKSVKLDILIFMSTFFRTFKVILYKEFEFKILKLKK
tara:strand:- start:448 stop:1035 length:588 start_codon:yes stop_codon:yes gene_type:complete